MIYNSVVMLNSFQHPIEILKQVQDDTEKDMKYKALIVDVDGTLIPNRRDGMPSARVTEAVATASKIVHVGIASSRPPFLLRHIIDHLKLSGPSIVNNGGQVIDFALGKTFYRQPVEKNDVAKIYEITKRYNVPLRLDTDEEDLVVSDNTVFSVVLGLYIAAIDLRLIEKIRKELDAVPTISSHTIPSWTKGKWTLTISHAKATKQHAIWEVAKVLNIHTHEIIGVGDGYNDFPLLMACGLKVAMGNAVDDIKAIADYVAPSVEEDGVADVIEKFVIN